MALEINAQFSKFVQFAEQQMQAGNGTAIARTGDDVAEPLGVRTIVAATGDKVAPVLKRSQPNQDMNNATRTLFRNTIAAIFGGEQNIPQNVRDAMKLDDYGQGKPLTARRIIAVKAAVYRIAQPHVAFNENVHASISSGHFERLPQNMQAGLALLVDDLRAVFGDIAVPPGATISQIVNALHVTGAIDEMRNSANGQMRDLTAEEIVALYAGKALERLSADAAGEAILAKIRAREPDIQFTARSIGSQFDMRYPGLLAEIRSCRNPVEIAAAIQRREAEIDAFVDVAVRSNAANGAAEARACEKLASVLGLDVRFVTAHVPTDKLHAEARDLTSAIMLGDAPGSREQGYDVEAAYDALVDEFVQKRVDAYAAVDSLDLPEDVKNRWKAEFIVYRDVPKLTPAQLFEVLKSVDARQIEGVLSKGLPMKVAVEMLNNIVKGIDDAICRVTGNPNLLVGVDEMMPVYGMLIVAAEAKSPRLAQAIQSARDALLASVDEYCESKGLNSASLFVKSLDVKGGTTKNLPVTNETKYLALVAEDVEAALNEADITNAKVRTNVRDVMLKRVRAALAGKTSLGELSALLATFKTEAKTLAKTLDAIANMRKAALGAAATQISVSTGLSRAYVLNNLSVRGIASDTGKLRLLYKDVMDKAKKGEEIDQVAVMNKINDIVVKFAQSKVAIIKALDEAGFGPADRAACRARALRDPDWTDPNVVTVAAGLAGSTTVKNAMRLLAGALRGEAVAALDDAQLRDAFLVFGKTCITTLETAFGGRFAEWRGSADTMRLLLRMTLELLTKDHPGLAESLARLAESGRIDTLHNMLREGMNAISLLGMDYATLAQNNLMGEPAGEPIRATMGNPNLRYDAEAAQKCVADGLLYNTTSILAGMMTEGYENKAGFNAEKCIARKTTGAEMVVKYAVGLSQETVPLLVKLVDTLDWRASWVARSEEIVKNYVEDLKAWRDVASGTADSAGLERVLLRRMNGYLSDVLASDTKFNTAKHPGLFQTFLDDLPRCNYVINGKKLHGERLEDRLPSFMDAIKDQTKRKVVSVMINQQIYGDFTTSVGNRVPFAGWKNGMEDEPVDGIPGIEKFSSRDIAKTGYQLFATGPMEFAVEVSPDESTVTVRSKSLYPLHADISQPDATIGNSVVTQDFVIDFTGEAPVIRDLKIGQALSA